MTKVEPGPTESTTTNDCDVMYVNKGSEPREINSDTCKRINKQVGYLQEAPVSSPRETYLRFLRFHIFMPRLRS